MCSMSGRPIRIRSTRTSLYEVTAGTSCEREERGFITHDDGISISAIGHQAENGKSCLLTSAGGARLWDAT